MFFNKSFYDIAFYLLAAVLPAKKVYLAIHVN